MKKALLLAVSILLIGNTQLMAQERPPLVMQIELEWTLGGLFAGVAVGFMIWLTDPAGPLPLGEAMASGAAWGTLAGAGFGIYQMQRTARLPTRVVDVPAPDAGSSPDSYLAVALPVKAPLQLAVAERPRRTSPSWRGIHIPLLTLRF
ncbi:MAG: hypothetical protein OEW39_11820 [Deltaproteobacteria bacterium]|nr:hypothetical protein [Deltaproteobacteria bacterium]